MRVLGARVITESLTKSYGGGRGAAGVNRKKEGVGGQTRLHGPRMIGSRPDPLFPFRFPQGMRTAEIKVPSFETLSTLTP
jgi:hypothetical protein